MTPRLVTISFLCIAAIAFACGPRSRSEASTTQALAAAAPVQHRVELAGHPSDSRLASSFDVKVEHNAVRFSFDVTNVGKKHVELHFPNGQNYEFVVLDSLGREMWRWSTGRLFTQALQNRLLSGGEAIRIAEAWEQPRPHGRYTAIATLRSSNFPIVEKADFELP